MKRITSLCLYMLGVCLFSTNAQTNYVLKSGDTMTGTLSIKSRPGGWPSIDLFGAANDYKYIHFENTNSTVSWEMSMDTENEGNRLSFWYWDGSNYSIPFWIGTNGVLNGNGFGITNLNIAQAISDNSISLNKIEGDVVTIESLTNGTLNSITVEEGIVAKGSFVGGIPSTAYEPGLNAFAHGLANIATGNYSHAEGIFTTAGGTGSHAQGLGTKANGEFSHAAGRLASAEHDDTFVWSSSDDADSLTFSSTTNKQFNVYAENGIRLISGANGSVEIQGKIIGDGSGLSGIPADAIAGSLSADQLPATGYWDASGLSIDNLNLGTLSGDGSGITNLLVNGESLDTLISNIQDQMVGLYSNENSVVVQVTDNDETNGDNLIQAILTAQSMEPGGQPRSPSNRVAIIIPPGGYHLTEYGGLVVMGEYIDLIGQTSDRAAQYLYGASADISYPGVLCHITTDIRIENLTVHNSSTNTVSTSVAYYCNNSSSNIIMRNCSFSTEGNINPSMYEGVSFAGHYEDCVSGWGSFSYRGEASGVFINCKAGRASFGGGLSWGFGGASGSFVNCKAGDQSFGNHVVYSTARMVNCIAGSNSFGDYIIQLGATLINCSAKENSFEGSNQFLGTLVNCSAGSGSFGDFNTAANNFNYNGTGYQFVGGPLYADGFGLTNLNVDTAIPNGSISASKVGSDILTAVALTNGSIGDVVISSNLVVNGSFASGYHVGSMGEYAHLEGLYNIAFGIYSHAEGYFTEASAIASHAEGSQTLASGDYSHAEGYSAKAYGYQAHAEGFDTRAYGDSSHAEGYGSIATGIVSHAEGWDTEAVGSISHAAGTKSKALHDYTYVWSSSDTNKTFEFTSTTNDQFNVYANNGIRLVPGSNAAVKVEGLLQAERIDLSNIGVYGDISMGSFTNSAVSN